MFHWHLLNEQVSACLEVHLLGNSDLVEHIAERHDFSAPGPDGIGIAKSLWIRPRDMQLSLPLGLYRL